DLCFLGHRIGFKGGLKLIEKQVGIERENEISGLTGYDAVKLWNRYKSGDINSLITLIRYNRSDVLNLLKLIDIEIKMMKDFYS
ncbi:MAG: ribonuclease H-like domain-containing protein, partial [Thermoplasmata archaeon]